MQNDRGRLRTSMGDGKIRLSTGEKVKGRGRKRKDGRGRE